MRRLNTDSRKKGRGVKNKLRKGWFSRLQKTRLVGDFFCGICQKEKETSIGQRRRLY